MKTYCFTQSGSFRGHTRITVSSQEDAVAVSNLNQMKILNEKYVPSDNEKSVRDGYQISGISTDKYRFDLKAKEIKLTVMADHVDVSINNRHVGNIDINDATRRDFLEALINDRIVSVHIRIEPMIRNKVVKSRFGKQKIESEERFKVYLFYKI